jgi:hypothetical protein
MKKSLGLFTVQLRESDTFGQTVAIIEAGGKKQIRAYYKKLAHLHGKRIEVFYQVAKR